MISNLNKYVTRRSLILLGCGLLVETGGKVMALESYPFDPDSSCRMLPEEELRQLLDSAVATQDSLASLDGVFEATLKEDLSLTSRDVLASHPELSFNNGEMKCKMIWRRSRVSERLDISYEIPQQLMRNKYEDSILFQDEEKQVRYWTRTHQAVFVRRDLFHERGPDTWIIPGNSAGLRAFREDKRFDISGVQLPSGEYMIRIFRESHKDPFVFKLNSVFDNSISEWWAPGGLTHCRIQYERTSKGEAVPGDAVLETLTAAGEVISTWRLETKSITLGDPRQSFTLVLPPGTVVADNRKELYSGKVQSFTVEANGELRPLETVPFGSVSASLTPSSRHFGIGIWSVAGLVTLLCFRFYMSRPR